MNILLTFIGFRDPYVPGSMQPGPILSLLTLRDFDRVILLATPQTKNNLEQTVREIRAKKPALQIEQIETPLGDPNDYPAILETLRANYRQLRERFPAARYFISVKSGTAQMHACWFWLVASGEMAATLLNVHLANEERDDPQVVAIDLSNSELPVIRFQRKPKLTKPAHAVADPKAAAEKLGIIGTAPELQAALKGACNIAPTNVSVLLVGETGTGKEQVARLIHLLSPRKDRPFLTVNCAEIPENLAESILFGHVKGAFTSAVVNKKGMFEVAGSGTLFLDEIGNISMSIQAKLLRVLQEREFRAVGDTRTLIANFRLVTATNKDLKAMVAAGTFRDDLYYRINIFPIHAPALRERKDDIPALAYHFLKVFSTELGKKVTDISEGAMSALVNYGWPGNVRELENVMHRAAILTTDNVIRQAHLINILDPSQPQADFAVPRTGDELKRVKKAAREKSVEEIEKQFVLEALKRNEWNVTKSAEDTGMQRPNFQALMKKYTIRVRDTEHDGGDIPDAS